MTTVLIADDHPIVLEGLTSLLQASRYEVIGRCRTGLEALASWQKDQPEILLLDLNMPAPGGIEVARLVLRENPHQQIVLLTSTIRNPEVAEALQLGVAGVVLKESAPVLLIDCLRAVQSGQRWIDPEIAYRTIITPVGTGRASADVLTPRELEVTKLLADGLRNKQIAQELGLTEGTVKIYLHGIYSKLNVRSRVELVNIARNKRLV